MTRRMKDSGVEWIGEIPEDWNMRKLKAVITCKDGERVPIDSGLRETGPYPYWGAGSITDYVNDYLFDEELVLLGEDGAPFFDRKRNVAFLIREKVWVNNHIHVLKADKDVLSSYLVHFLNIVDFSCYINGSILNKLTQSNMNRINIVFPDKHDQKMIADFLDEKVREIDSVIAKTKETIEDYKKYKQTIISDAVTKGLNPDVEMKESGIEWIGKIPKHWKMLRIKNIAKEIGDGLHSTPEYDENGDVFFINGNNIGDEYLIVKENTNKLNETERRKYKLPLLNENTIMIALNGATYGKTSFYSGEKVLLGKSAGYITLKEMCNKKYIRYFLQSYSAKYFMVLSLNGTTIQNLSLNTLNNFCITYPNKVEQQKIVDFLDIICSEIDKLIIKKEKLLVDLENYKKSLIYEYVTGKKEVE